jgi:hypothetical protein
MAMTEEEWLACSDPQAMLEQLRGKASVRKDQLLAVAWLRQVPTWEPAHARSIEFLEQRAEGSVAREKSQRAAANARHAIPVDTGRDEHGEDRYSVALMLYRVLASRQAAHHALHAIGGLANWRNRQEPACRLLRELFGNPFRPVTLNPAWRTANVTALAQAIYDDRAFDRLPILADALEDGGCDNGDILNHCRQPGEHVRGCWVVDLVLGRE